MYSRGKLVVKLTDAEKLDTSELFAIVCSFSVYRFYQIQETLLKCWLILRGLWVPMSKVN